MKKIIVVLAVALSLTMLSGCSILFGGGSKKFSVNVGNDVSYDVKVYAKGSADKKHQACDYNHYVTCNVDTGREFPDLAKGSRVYWTTTETTSYFFLTDKNLSGELDIIVTDSKGHYREATYQSVCRAAETGEEPVFGEEKLAYELTAEEAAALGFTFEF